MAGAGWDAAGSSWHGQRWRNAARDETCSPGRAKAKQVDCGAPANPSPAKTGLFRPLKALRFLPGQKGAPFQLPGPALPCRGQDPFLPGPSHRLKALEGGARLGSGGTGAGQSGQRPGAKPCSVPSHCVVLSQSCALLDSVSPCGRWCWAWIPGVCNHTVLNYLEEATQQLQLYPSPTLGVDMARAQTCTPVRTPHRNNNNTCS